MIELLGCCMQNIRGKRFRSMLTACSVAIGVASVVLVGSIGKIGQDAIAREAAQLGTGTLAVSVDKNITKTQFSEGAIAELEKLGGVESVTPIIMKYTRTGMCGLVGSAAVWGVDSGAAQVLTLKLLHGRLLTPDDIRSGRRVCVVDENMAQLFYKRANIVGKTAKITLGGVAYDFTVVGVVSAGSNIMQTMLESYVPSFLYAPYSTVQTLSREAGYNQLAIDAATASDLTALEESVISALVRATGERAEYFKVQNFYGQKQTLDSILGSVTSLLALIAAVSLLVAGLGIMTVMMVTVGERTREIGVKKAVGAKRWHIVVEFLFEAVLLSLAGTVIGIACGVAVVAAGCILLGLDIQLHYSLIMTTTLANCAIGVLCSAYPAYLASKLCPVDALRFDG